MRITGIKINLFILVLATFTIFNSVMPSYAITPCQGVQQTVDLYVNANLGQYCKYTPEIGESEVTIWRDCDYRSTIIVARTYSVGSIDFTQSGTRICCNQNTICYWNGVLIPDTWYSESYTDTYYKENIKAEYCDGHFETTVMNYGTTAYAPFPPKHFRCTQGACGGSGSCDLTPVVVPQDIDCSHYVTHTLYTTIPIPSECNCLDPTDKCCINPDDECCGDPDPCCGTPADQCCLR